MPGEAAFKGGSCVNVFIRAYWLGYVVYVASIFQNVMKKGNLHVYISIPCVYHAARHPDMECRSATDLKLWFSNYAAIGLEPRRGNSKPDNDARIFIYRIYMLFNSLLVLSASWIQPRASELQEALIEGFYGKRKRRSARKAGRSGYNEFLNKSSSMSDDFNDASC